MYGLLLLEEPFINQNSSIGYNVVAYAVAEAMRKER